MLRGRCWVALLLLTVWAVVVGTAPALAEEPDPVAAAATHLYDCLQTGETVSVLFLMDRSGSLAKDGGDPDGLRFDALETALTGLSRLQGAEGRPLDVEVAISAFNDEYHDASGIVPWRRINGPDADDVVADTVASARARIGTRGGTDFEKALGGAYGDFNPDQRVSDCRVLFWFTDGDFTTAGGKDLQDDGAAVAQPKIDAARSQMCAPGSGILDRIRRAGIVVFGLQLGEISDDLRRMSVGTLSGQACGTYPMTDGEAPGGYLQADEAEQLNSIFSRLTDLAEGCVPTGALGGVLDPGIGRAVVRVLRDDVAPSVPATEAATLVGPGGLRLAVSVPGEQAVDGYTLVAEHDAGQLAIRVTLPDGSPPGIWTVEAPFTPRGTQWCVWPDITLVPAEGNEPLTAGEEGVVRTEVQRLSGKPIDLAQFSAVDATVAVHGADGQSQGVEARVDGASIVVTVTPAETDAQVRTTTTLRLVTESGLELSPIALEATYPVVSDRMPLMTPLDKLHLGTIERTGTGEAGFEIVGPTTGPSQVCFGVPGEVRSPVAGETARLRYDQGCVQLAPGERRAVPVSFTPSAEAVGRGTSSIPVTLVAAVSEGQQPSRSEVEVEVSWYQDIPINPAVFLAMFLAILLVTVFLVWAAILGAMWAATRFDTKNLRWLSIPVLMGSDPIRPDKPDAEARVLLADRELNRKARRLGSRRFKVGNVEFRARTPLLPGGAPRYTATVPEGYLVNSANYRSTIRRGREVAVPPGLGLYLVAEAETRVVQHSRPGAPLPVTLHVLCADRSVTGEQVDERIRQYLRDPEPRNGWMKDCGAAGSPPTSST